MPRTVDGLAGRLPPGEPAGTHRDPGDPLRRLRAGPADLDGGGLARVRGGPRGGLPDHRDADRGAGDRASLRPLVGIRHVQRAPGRLTLPVGDPAAGGDTFVIAPFTPCVSDMRRIHTGTIPEPYQAA